MNELLYYYDTGEGNFAGGYPVYINRYEEPSEPHLHAHDFAEIAFVQSGSGIHRIGDREYTVKKGDLFLINYDTPHEFRSLPELLPESPLVVCNCIFRPEFIDKEIADFKDFADIAQFLLYRSLFPNEVEELVHIELNGPEARMIEQLYEKLLLEFTLKEDGYVGLLRSYTTELLIWLLRIVKKAGRDGTNSLKGHSEVIGKVTDYLKSNYQASLKLKELSTLVFLSPNYICRLFKDSTGMTISEYIQKVRIEEACKLLEETDKKVIEVAGEVGYHDMRHFQEVFKRIAGSSPGAYRKHK